MTEKGRKAVFDAEQKDDTEENKEGTQCAMEAKSEAGDRKEQQHVNRCLRYLQINVREEVAKW